MRHCACLRSRLLAEPDYYRTDKQRDTHNQESVVKCHNVGFAPDNILDLAVGMMGRTYGIIAFVEKNSGISLHPLLNHGTVGIDICSDLEVVELLASSDDRAKHSCADAPAKAPRK